MKILVTGGAGYIGSHTVIELIARGHEPVIVDNFSNSNPAILSRLKQISGASIPHYDADVTDATALRNIFDAYQFDAVLHFAGLKAVGESAEKPLLYYRANIDSSLTLCEVMGEHGVKNLIFSSSATVYGADAISPYVESAQAGVNISNPYGQTKFVVECMLRDLAASDPSWAITALRYFNPIGAHPSGLIGEDPHGTPNNLMPYMTQVAVGKRPELSVFGGDYDTQDGTGERDYIHVVDLAKGHVAALEHLQPSNELKVYNLGSGAGTTVLQLIAAFEKASGKALPYKIVNRRAGDLPSYYAVADKAKDELGWQTEKTIEDACADSWRWQSLNPDGYDGR